MKILQRILLVVILGPLSTLAMADIFCDGFDTGYIDGYRQASQTSFTPSTPACPARPSVSFGDPDSEFTQGYAIGFMQGMLDGQ